MENSPGLHSSAHRGPLKSGIVLIYKYINIYNIYVRHTDRICKLIKYKKRLKKRIGKLTRGIYYFPRLLYCLLQHKPVPSPFFISRAHSGGRVLCPWHDRGSPCPGLRFPRPCWGSVGWGCSAPSYWPPIFWQVGPSSQLPGRVGSCPHCCVRCVSILGTRCVWPRALVHLCCVLSFRELSPCGHCSRELERRVSRLDGGQRQSPHPAPQRASPGLGDLGPSKVPFL